MDVFLVPVGTDRYELYCEEAESSTAADEAPPSGLFQRWKRRFDEMLAEAERERRGGISVHGQAWTVRLRRRVMRWVAESIAEQRLLWQLRREREAALLFPDDLNGPEASTILRRHLSRDFERHRFWLAIDALGLVASGALVLVPGPNVVAYYFAFRMVGHFLSLRGARQGLDKVRWHTTPSAPLAELRAMAAEPPHARAQRVDAVAQRLRLEHFARFFQRTATEER